MGQQLARHWTRGQVSPIGAAAPLNYEFAKGMAAGLLIAYEALAVTLLLLFLLFGISRLVKSRLNRRRTPEAVHERDPKHHGSR
jgi:uncharacterized membrane protein YhiD involved in acid resistance